MSDTPKPRAEWGQVHHRADRPGFAVRFTWDGVRYERRTLARANAGRQRRTIEDEDAARAALRLTREMLESGKHVSVVLATVYGDARPKASGPRTFRALAALYVASPHYATGLRPRTRDDYRVRLVVACRAAWAGRPLSHVTPDVIGAWAASLGARGPSGERVQGPTVNRYLSAVGAVFAWAKAEFVIPNGTPNPCRDVARRAENPGTKVALTEEEGAALVEACDEWIRPLVVVCLLTSLRIAAVLDLRWRSVDLERGVLTLEPESDKIGEGNTYEMSPDLLAVFQALRERRTRPTIDSSDHVFTQESGRHKGRKMTRRVAALAFKRARSRVASILGAGGTPDEARERVARWVRKRDGVMFHKLRHSAATWAAADGCSPRDVQATGGWKSAKTMARYVHATDGATGRVVASLSATLSAARARLAPPPIGATSGAAVVSGPFEAPAGGGAWCAQVPPPAEVVSMEAPRGIEPRYTDLQSATVG